MSARTLESQFLVSGRDVPASFFDSSVSTAITTLTDATAAIAVDDSMTRATLGSVMTTT